MTMPVSHSVPVRSPDMPEAQRPAGSRVPIEEVGRS